MAAEGGPPRDRAALFVSLRHRRTHLDPHLPEARHPLARRLPGVAGVRVAQTAGPDPDVSATAVGAATMSAHEKSARATARRRLSVHLDITASPLRDGPTTGGLLASWKAILSPRQSLASWKGPRSFSDRVRRPRPAGLRAGRGQLHPEARHLYDESDSANRGDPDDRCGRLARASEVWVWTLASRWPSGSAGALPLVIRSLRVAALRWRTSSAPGVYGRWR
jgi:hypothetical protein